jgi:hypothetical protein
MIRELVMALVLLCLAASVTLWFSSGPRVDVRKIEANLAR